MSSKSRQTKNPNFFQKVYDVVRLIPEGRFTSYGAITRYIGSPGAARMVGWAMNNCHTLEESLPAHRVLNRNGMLTGKNHFRHPDLMQQLLESEGITIEKDKVKDVAKHFWDPNFDLI